MLYLSFKILEVTSAGGWLTGNEGKVEISAVSDCKEDEPWRGQKEEANVGVN